MERAPFSNATIAAPVESKPHICVRLGWWRVSKMPKDAAVKRYRWHFAHNFTNELNFKGVDDETSH